MRQGCLVVVWCGEVVQDKIHRREEKRLDMALDSESGKRYGEEIEVKNIASTSALCCPELSLLPFHALKQTSIN